MYHLIVERDPQQKAREERGHAQLVGMSLLAKAPAASVGGELDGAAAASPPGAVLTPGAESDPNPSPPHFFADGDWSVGPLKVRSA
jgi:hypothetical protein